MKRVTCMAIGLLLSASLAACSSSSKKTATTGSGSSTSAKPATGTPIVFGTNGSDHGNGFDQFEFQDGFEAWAKQLTANGGVDGHPVTVQRCNDQGTPTQSGVCARNQIGDTTVIASMGFSPFSGQVSAPAYKAANMTFVQPYPVSGADYQNDTFATTAGTLGAFGGLAYNLAKTQGLTKIAVMHGDIASTKSVPDLVKASIAAGSGGQLVADVTHPLTQVDFSASVLQAKAAGAQVIFLGEQTSAVTAIFKAAVAVGYTGAFALPGVSMIPANVATQAQTGVKVFAEADFPDINTSSDPEIANFKSAMQAAGFTNDVDQGALSGYETGKLYEVAMRKIGGVKVTRQSFLDQIKSITFTNVPLFPANMGLQTAPKNLPAAINTTAFQQEFSNGKATFNGDRFDFANVLDKYTP